MQDLYERIHADPEFHTLEARRGRFSWLLSTIVFTAYFSFILIIAFAPTLLARPVFAGQAMSLGIPVGLAIIILSFLLTGVYVRRANTEFDTQRDRIIRRHRQGA